MSQSKIHFEGGEDYLMSELEGYLHELHEQGVDASLSSTRGIYKAAFLDIGIFVNEHLTELIVTGYLAPALYDIIKSSFLAAIRAIRRNVQILQPGKTRNAEPYISFAKDDTEINILISDEIPDEDLVSYLEGALALLKDGEIRKDVTCFIEKSATHDTPQVKTIQQYVKDRQRSQAEQ